MLASMIFRKEPFFHGHDNYDQVEATSLIRHLHCQSKLLMFQCIKTMSNHIWNIYKDKKCETKST